MTKDYVYASQFVEKISSQDNLDENIELADNIITENTDNDQ